MGLYPYILGVKVTKTVDSKGELAPENMIVEKVRFGLEGHLHSSTTDLYSNGLLERNMDGMIVNGYVDSDGKKVLTSVKKSLKLYPVAKPIDKVAHISNTNIGVIDLETFLDTDGGSLRPKFTL